MKKYKGLLIGANLILVLLYINFSVLSKEKLLTNGKIVFFELAPVDPRSLMQGDYMLLQYKMLEDIQTEGIPNRGYCIISIDDKNIAHFIKIQSEAKLLKDNQFLLAYRATKNQGVRIGAESFFFQEGEGIKYEKAKYGGLRLDEDGTSILEGLYDEHLHKIE